MFSEHMHGSLKKRKKVESNKIDFWALGCYSSEQKIPVPSHNRKTWELWASTQLMRLSYISSDGKRSNYRHEGDTTDKKGLFGTIKVLRGWHA